MKILMVSGLFPPDVMGGAELTLADLADALAGRGHAVDVLCVGETASEHVRPSGVRVRRQRIPNLYPVLPLRQHGRLARTLWHGLDSANPGGYRLVRRAIADTRPDLVLADMLAGISATAWLAARHAGVPVLQRLCDAYLVSPSLKVLFAPPGSPGALVRRLLRRRHAGLSRSVTGVVGLSRAILDLHAGAGLFGGVPMEVIPTAMAPAVPAPPRQPDGQLRLGFIGQLVPTKGIETLLAGFLAADPDATLDIAGTGRPDYVAMLKRRFADPRIRFLGWAPNKAGFFAGIDLCVVPSQVFDTLPTVVIEAFAHHVPALAAPVGGIPEMIEPGRNGRLAPLGTAAEVAAALRLTLADPQAVREMATGVAAASSRFLDREAWLDRWEAALERARQG